MAERAGPHIFSIAAHRGFADALVAGLVPRYAEEGTGLARLTLLVPSTRAQRTISEAFIRYFGEQGLNGMLLPRMAVVGDLDLDEALGSLLDPLGAAHIPPAVDPTWRWLRLAEIMRTDGVQDAPQGAALMRLAREMARAMDRLLVEDIEPEELLSDRVLDTVGDLSEHWRKSLHRFARTQEFWRKELEQAGRIDAARRRNLLFDHATKSLKSSPPDSPIVAAGVTSAAPALARLLRVISDLPQGAVILPDFDLSLDDTVWQELGRAGIGKSADDPPFAPDDAVTHPQYHMKLLLNRMGIAREEVRPWHRKGMTAARPDRSHAVSSLFLPPEASKSWAGMHADLRRLAGVRVMQCANPEEEAQSVALLVRQALEEPGKRVSVITPDRGLAGRIVRHLRRWHIEADDSAGQPLSQTTAGRLILLMAELVAEEAAPVPLMALLGHPLVQRGEGRGAWLADLRVLEMALRGPRRATGLAAIAAVAKDCGVSQWWGAVEAQLAPIMLASDDKASFATLLDLIISAGQSLCGNALWEREDGRALSTFLEDLRLQARDTGTEIAPLDLPAVLRDAMEPVAVRPPWGGHPRVAIYGLLESRMSRADLTICAGLNEGTWPAPPAPDPLLPPRVMRVLGVPGTDFRIGLSAHDLAGALGAPEIVLSRSARDEAGPAIPSRFLLRVEALLGEKLLAAHGEDEMVRLARRMDAAARPEPYPRPEPKPSAEQRQVRVSVTALDRLRSDPYQFYANAILQLKELDALDADPSAPWQGEVAHKILESWHKAGHPPILTVARQVLHDMDGHPLMRALWEPRLSRALQWIEEEVRAAPDRKQAVIEDWGEITHRGVRLFGKADRIDQLPDGSFIVVDYKTGEPPSWKQAGRGYALQLGTTAFMAEQGGFTSVNGKAAGFEYWSFRKAEGSSTGFGKVASPVKFGRNRSDIEPEDFVGITLEFLDDAFDKWILGDEGFAARLNPDAKVYNSYDQLMRLDEWLGREE